MRNFRANRRPEPIADFGLRIADLLGFFQRRQTESYQNLFGPFTVHARQVKSDLVSPSLRNALPCGRATARSALLFPPAAEQQAQHQPGRRRDQNRLAGLAARKVFCVVHHLAEIFILQLFDLFAD